MGRCSRQCLVPGPAHLHSHPIHEAEGDEGTYLVTGLDAI